MTGQFLIDCSFYCAFKVAFFVLMRTQSTTALLGRWKKKKSQISALQAFLLELMKTKILSLTHTCVELDMSARQLILSNC